MQFRLGRYDTQHNDIRHKDTQHNDAQQKGFVTLSINDFQER
jgi:hypothetical protein